MRISRWQTHLQDVIRSVDALPGYPPPGSGTPGLSAHGAKEFPLKTTRAFADRINRDDPDDPLLRQILPLPEEDLQLPGYGPDPLAEQDPDGGTGVLKKYHGRALLITTGVCAIHCRYCFRRHFPYTEQNAARQTWQPAITALAADDSIREVILSGGDPLSLSDAKLGGLIRQLDSLPHLQRLRIHTRIPVVLPQRITPDLLALLSASRLRAVVVIHCNHAREIDDEVQAALLRLHQAGITLMNQSVLLRGVNDDAVTLAELSEQLFACHVLPYYLHMLDPVAGAAHFDVPDAEAVEIMQALRNLLPGYLVPRLVRELPGTGSKKPLL